jgi:hypothetical protein
MTKRLAAFAATGALALGALAGTAGSANATVARPDGGSTCSPHHGCFDWEGAFTNSVSCVNFVASIGQLSSWDCEYYNPAWFSTQGPGWYATSIYFPRYP